MNNGRMKDLVARVAMVFFAVIVIGLYVSIQEGTHPDALVVVDDVRRVYISPPCMSEATMEYLAAFEGQPRTVMRNEAVYELDYDPEPLCREQGGFGGSSASLLRVVLSSLGVWWMPESRWQEDGTWNW